MKRVEIDGPDERVVDAMIEAGLCKDANEVVHVSLNILRERNKEKLRALKKDLEVGLEDARQGRIITPTSVAETTARYRARLEAEND